MRLPSSFCMLLRGKVVEYHNIATDLKYPEFIVYRPHNGRSVEVVAISFFQPSTIVDYLIASSSFSPN